MHFLFFAIGATLIAWGASDIALNVLDEGTRPLIVTYGGIANTAIGFILMGLGRCIQLLQNMQRGASRIVTAATPVAVGNIAAGKAPDISEAEPESDVKVQESNPEQIDFPELTPEQTPEPTPQPRESLDQTPTPEPELPQEPEPEPAPTEEPANISREIQPPDRGKIAKQGDIRGYPFHLYENGEIELETKSGWHTFRTIEEVQSHIAAEAGGDQESDGK